MVLGNNSFSVVVSVALLLFFRGEFNSYWYSRFSLVHRIHFLCDTRTAEFQTVEALGSCKAAGYTECCNVEETGTPCAGYPQDCFCDPSCKQFNDCCPDLDQICRDPALGKIFVSV